MNGQASKFIFNVSPMGAVRTTQRQKWVDPRAKKYYAYKQEIAGSAASQSTVGQPTPSPLALKMVFVMPIPESWSKKKRWDALNKAHMTKPDLDNLIKGCTDALNGVVWQDDKQIIAVEATKVYGFEPRIELYVTEMRGQTG
ncbi:RusA family crossover junction endodeoxyribonuclease [Brevibacillus sp. MER 51]|uniref:RusA family crossover junction endodeoxyribonuclease n=1 Tax=Brevibacillus sp. MER 51 TaxID=2939560 RepID=UPI00203C3714|nr:RusA family crossover junction endodeoxyribonuclease [Brevibacillus sp. MER 51]MCM3141695.1 RusA family crossover junction endodeoxyribonuclease [Brevibacillus sp. MER 51]